MRVSVRTVSGGAQFRVRPYLGRFFCDLRGRLPFQHGFRRRITLQPLSRKGNGWAGHLVRK
jgi:hypothetical protein